LEPWAFEHILCLPETFHFSFSNLHYAFLDAKSVVVVVVVLVTTTPVLWRCINQRLPDLECVLYASTGHLAFFFVGLRQGGVMLPLESAFIGRIYWCRAKMMTILRDYYT